MVRLRPLLFLVALMAALAARATHNRAGEIVYCADPDNPLRYFVQIITHTKTSAPADRPELEIYWGDGSSDTLPRVSITPIPGADAQRWQDPRLALSRHVLPEFDMRLQIIETRCAVLRESAVV